MIVDCAAYRDGYRVPGLLELEQALEAAREPGTFVWIGLHEPTAAEFEAVEKEFGLHKLAVEDALAAHQRPKIEVYAHNIFVVLKTARYIDEEECVEFAEIHLFIGDDYVVSVRHGAASALSEVRKAAEERPELLRRGPAAVLYAIIDRVVDDYVPVIDGLDNDLQEVEHDVFSAERVNSAERIYFLKQEVLDFQRNTSPLLEPLEALSRGQYKCNHPELAPFFRDIADHLARITGRIEGFREVLTDALHANLAQISVRQNDDMRTISAWVAIVAVPTMVGAIYGMNFDHMPELRWQLGYPLSLALIFLGCLYIWRRFKKSGWL